MDRDTRDRMRRQLVASVRAGESVQRVAERLLDDDRPIVRMPEHVRGLAEAARDARTLGDPRIYRDEVARWRSRIEALGQGPQRSAGAHTVRSATQRLVRELANASAEQIDKVVDRWVLERARHQARMIARTETVEAFRDVYRQGHNDKPYVVGYRWTLSGSHPRPDVCDVLASQDLDGLGPGGYRPDNLPSNPHPHDLCSQVAIIDEQHFKRELARQRKQKQPDRPWLSGRTESGQQWLQSKPEAFQRKLLGPTRLKLMRQGEQVIDNRGVPIPVGQLTGQRTRRRLGPKVDATPVIRRDRDNQVQPFPRVPPVRR